MPLTNSTSSERLLNENALYCETYPTWYLAQSKQLAEDAPPARSCSELLGTARSCSELRRCVGRCSELLGAAQSFPELFGASGSRFELLGAYVSCSALLGTARSCSSAVSGAHLGAVTALTNTRLITGVWHPLTMTQHPLRESLHIAPPSPPHSR